MPRLLLPRQNALKLQCLAHSRNVYAKVIRDHAVAFACIEAALDDPGRYAFDGRRTKGQARINDDGRGWSGDVPAYRYAFRFVFKFFQQRADDLFPGKLSRLVGL